MSRSKLILTAFTVSLLATAAGMQVAMAQNDTAQTQSGEGGGHGFFHSMAPEARMMLFVQMHADTANMSDDQKHAYREQQRAKFGAMSDADKQKFAADLQAKWNALPAAQQDQIKQQFAAYRAQRMQQMQGAGGGGGQ